MTMRCKTWCAAVTAIIGASAAAGWYVTRPDPAPIVAPSLPPAPDPHASPPQVLAAAAERLHREALAHFHADPKNGMARMPFVYEKIAKEWKSPWFSTGELDREESLPFAKDMTRLHEATHQDFLTRPLPKQDDAAVQAVVPLSSIIWDPSKYDRSKKVWEAKSVDLVGLLKHDGPIVYVSEKVAHQTNGGDTATRPLDEFELAGLAALNDGEDLFGRTRDGVIRLLGAVRAETSCLACHRDHKDRDLLGAFSYTLREASYEQLAWPGRKKSAQ